MVMELMCVVKGVKPVKVPDPSGSGRMQEDYFAAAQRHVLSDSSLKSWMERYIEVDLPKVTPKLMKDIRGYLDTKELSNPADIERANRACGQLVYWVKAISDYDAVMKKIQPLKEDLASAQSAANKAKQSLDVAQAELNKVEEKINKLQRSLDENISKKESLEKQSNDCTVKLERAAKLLGGLGGEKSRWTLQRHDMEARLVSVVGDTLLSSSIIAYLGVFTSAFRDTAVSSWVQLMRQLNIDCSENFSFIKVLGEPVEIQKWVLNGLPNDSFSVENGIIASNSPLWPLFIDPQGQANKWIKNLEKERRVIVLKPTDQYSRVFETALTLGRPVLLENMGLEVDPMLDPLLAKAFYKKGSLAMLRWGNAELEYNKDFKFYMTTKLRNPQYLPEVSSRVALLNCMITPEGLDDQLLGLVVAQEKPELERARMQLVTSNAENAHKLQEIESKILETLKNSSADVLDDEEAISVLSSSKVISNQIEEEQVKAKTTEESINITRLGYVPVAKHASVLFFCISSLANIDPMYQYSLAWFISLYSHAIASSEPSGSLEKRIQNLNSFFLYSVYENTCRSLFFKDKLLFSLVLCVRLQIAMGKIDKADWRFFLTGGVDVGEALPPRPGSLAPPVWGALVRLSRLKSFAGLSGSFAANAEDWQALLDSPEPQSVSFPGDWHDKLDLFHKLVVIRTLRPEKVLPAARVLVAAELGARFVESPSFSLRAAVQSTPAVTPVVFVLSPGADPITPLTLYAKDVKMDSKFVRLSLGQGQGLKAKQALEQASKEGLWLLLENCHLMPSWMPSLTQLVDELDPASTHPKFRLWLSSYPSKDFPALLLQNAVKLTMEAPGGLRANLQSSLKREPMCHEAFYDQTSKPLPLRTLTLSLCFFHAVVQERRGFGPLGWNILYGFNETDQNISVLQLRMFLDSTSEISFKALWYLIGECNYGGRVTDEWDRRVLRATLKRYVCPEAFGADYALDSQDEYLMPPAGSVSSFATWVGQLPAAASAQVFGLHPNAEISREQQQTSLLLDSLVGTEDQGSGAGGDNVNSLLLDLASDIIAKLSVASAGGARFDTAAIASLFPLSHQETMNTVVVQECIRYNKLTSKIIGDVIMILIIMYVKRLCVF